MSSRSRLSLVALVTLVAAGVGCALDTAGSGDLFDQPSDDASTPIDDSGSASEWPAQSDSGGQGGGGGGSAGAGGTAGAGGVAGSGGAAGSGGSPADGGADAPHPGDGGCTPGTDACDLDCDTVRSSLCGGLDCCDTDSRSRPGQTIYFTTPDACGHFDYDCNGKDDPEYGAGTACSLGFFGCGGGAVGFEGTPPACGASGAWAACLDDFWSGCNDDPASHTQSCR